MSPWQLSPVLDDQTNLLLKFGKDLTWTSWDTGPQTLRWSDGRSAGRPAGQFLTIIIPLCGPTCKLRLASWKSTKVEFQVGPSVAIYNKIWQYSTIPDNIWQYLKILDNIGKYLTIQQYLTTLDKTGHYHSDIWQYQIILGNIGQY